MAIKVSVQDSSSFKKDAGNFTTQSQLRWENGKKRKCLISLMPQQTQAYMLFINTEFLFHATNLPIKIECNLTHGVLDTYCTPSSHLTPEYIHFPTAQGAF